MNDSTMHKSHRAPVAMFVYDNPEDTRASMKHLLANTQASETDLFVFSDEGKDELSRMLVEEVRRYLRETQQMVKATKALRSMTVVENPEHRGAERSFQEGMNYVLHNHEDIIVLYDFLITSPYFLAFMNQALALYRDVPEVKFVCGFSPLDLRKHLSGDFFFTTQRMDWGFGLWRNRMCKQGLADERICLLPSYPLVKNLAVNRRGFSWNLFRRRREFDRWPLFQPLEVTRVEQPQTDPAIEQQMEAMTQEIRRLRL